MAKSQKPSRSWWSRYAPATKSDLEKLEQRLNMKVSEVQAALEAVSVQVDKAKQEIVDKIAALEAAIGDADLPPEAAAALESLKAKVQEMDDIVPDAPPPTG